MNRIIRDIDLAPKNAQGLVDFSADFYIMRPQNANGAALVEVSNRGGKALTNVFDFAKMLRAYLPVATNMGKTISGMIHSEWVGEKLTEVIPTGDKAAIGYAVLDPNSSGNRWWPD